ncbi:MAG: hypothetical protein JKY53_00170 [Flavobacteriales bacterium]|nr:hypothetical protein [Flavobacteriales bacterium]
MSTGKSRLSDEDTYSWTSRYNATANDYAFYLKNTNSNKDLNIREIFVFSSVKCDFSVKFVTGTATGSTITGVNWNKKTSETADVIAKNSGVTGLSADGDIIDIDVDADNREFYNFDGSLILGENDAIGIKVDATATVSIITVGDFE